jgi:CRP-like cAMP-binding protein
VRELRSPAYVGEIGIIHGIARTATVVTSTDCHVWKIPADAFLQAAGQAGLSGALTDGVMVRLHASSSVS